MGQRCSAGGGCPILRGRRGWKWRYELHILYGFLVFETKTHTLTWFETTACQRVHGRTNGLTG